MTTTLQSLDHLVCAALLPLLVFYLVFGFDDLFIDLCAWFLGLRPELVTAEEFSAWPKVQQKRIAILIAAWKESSILDRMIRGNLRDIQYQNYDIFLGVYLNDPETCAEAVAIAARFPRIHVAFNPSPGPTCKAQMLNHLFWAAYENESLGGEEYTFFLIQDSEDVIHPWSLALLNARGRDYEFMQIPVFSLPVSQKSLVSGIYVDEFSESHTKDMLVRDRFQASIPSAGVGTALSSTLVKRIMQGRGGDPMSETTLTEDYELGVSSWKYGAKSKFLCCYIEKPDGGREYIATREYFPKTVRRSVRQKARWTLGIAFQGLENLGWRGSLVHRYFLYRDRKGPVANSLLLLGTVVSAYLALRLSFHAHLRLAWGLGFVAVAVPVTMALMVNRVLQRMRAVKTIYGWKPIWLVPVRWPLGNFINSMAAIRSTYQYANSKLSGVQPKWVKTEHELPAQFGQELTKTLSEINPL